MADGAPIGALAVRIGADANQLVAELGRADKSLGKTQERFDLAMRAATVFATAAAAAGAAMALTVKSAIDNADAMSKMAQGAGIATRAFTEYAHAAKLSDLSNEQLAQAFSKLNVSVIDAARGTGEATLAYKALGIEVQNTDGSIKASDQLMEELADALMGVDDAGVRAGLSAKIFGERLGKEIIPMLAGGSAGLREMREEARLLGVAIDTEAGKAAEEFNDNLTRLGQVQQGLANQLMSELLPALVQVSDAMVKGATESGGFSEEIKGLASFIQGSTLTVLQTLAVVGSDVAFVFKMIGGEIGVWAAQLAALASGDFKGFRLIGQEWSKDAEQARKDLDDFQNRVMNLKAAVAGGAEGAGGAMDMGVGLGGVFNPKRAAPGIAGAGGGKGDEMAARQIQEGVEEELRIMQEAQELIVEQRNLELETEQEHFNERMRILMEYYDAKTAADEEAAREAFELQKRYMTDLEKFQAMSYRKQAQTIFGELAGITAGVAQHNKTLFEMNKVAGIAMAVMNAYEGISLTMAKYPYPLNIGMAAAHGIAAFAQVQAIRNTSFGGGGGAAPSIAGSTAAPPVSPVTSGSPGGSSGGGGQTTIVNLNGETFGRKQVQALLEQLNEEGVDGGRLVIQ